MRATIKYLMVIIITVLLTACGQISKQSSGENDPKIFDNKNIGISLITPGTWTLTKDSNYPSIDIIGYRPDQSFRPNFTIASESHSGTSPDYSLSMTTFR